MTSGKLPRVPRLPILPPREKTENRSWCPCSVGLLFPNPDLQGSLSTEWASNAVHMWNKILIKTQYSLKSSYLHAHASFPAGAAIVKLQDASSLRTQLLTNKCSLEHRHWTGLNAVDHSHIAKTKGCSTSVISHSKSRTNHSKINLLLTEHPQ